MPSSHEGRMRGHDGADHSDRGEAPRFYLRLSPPYQTAGEFQLAIPIEDGINLVGRSSKLLSSIQHPYNAQRLWQDAAIERLFWSFWRAWRQFNILGERGSRSILTTDDLRIVSRNVRLIIEATHSVYHLTSLTEMTINDFILLCLPDPARLCILQLRSALQVLNGNEIERLGRICQHYGDVLQAKIDPVRNWFRRRYVGAALGIEPWDLQTCDNSTRLAQWMGQLEDVMLDVDHWMASVDDKPGPSEEARAPTPSIIFPPVHHTPIPALSATEALTNTYSPSYPPDNISDCTEDDDGLNEHVMDTPRSDNVREFVHLDDTTFYDLTTHIQYGEQPSAYGASATIYQGVLDLRGVLQVVALKAYHSGEQRDAGSVFQHLRRELHLWSKLDHINILPIIGVCYLPHGDFPCLVSPWCKHGSAIRYLKSQREHGRSVVPLVLDLLEQLLAALEYLHERDHPIVHGDIKGSNIFVNDQGCMKLSDFGLSRMPGRIGSVYLESSSSGGRGTVPFMSPEQIDGGSPSVYSDMWAVSCTFVEMLTGRAPYADKPNVTGIIIAIVTGQRPTRPEGVSDALWDLVSTNWNTVPSERLSAKQMAHELRSLRRSTGCITR